MVSDELKYHQKHLRAWMKERWIRPSKAQLPGNVLSRPSLRGNFDYGTMELSGQFMLCTLDRGYLSRKYSGSQALLMQGLQVRPLPKLLLTLFCRNIRWWKEVDNRIRLCWRKVYYIFLQVVRCRTDCHGSCRQTSTPVTLELGVKVRYCRRNC